MPAIRLFGSALLATVIALPALASGDIQLRGRLEADFLPDTKDSNTQPEIMPTVLVTEKAGQGAIVSKPAILRYEEAVPDVPARLVAENRGQDPDRAVETDPEGK